MSEIERVLSELTNSIPGWGKFHITRSDLIYQVNISIESVYGLKPFKITTESTSLLNSIKQALTIFKNYWMYKEETSPELEQMIKELEEEGIIETACVER